MTLHIRDATRADAAVILGFISELAAYEKAGHEVLADLGDIERSLFDDPASPARALIGLLESARYRFL